MLNLSYDDPLKFIENKFTKDSIVSNINTEALKNAYDSVKESEKSYFKNEASATDLVK